MTPTPEQIAKMRSILLRVGWPNPGDDACRCAELSFLADEVQEEFHRADLDDNYDGAPINDGREWPQAENE